MPKNYTPDTLLQYVYKELSPREMAAIKQALHHDSELAGEFRQLCESIDLLEDIDLQPSNSSIKIIMEHSLQAHETTT